MTEYQKDLKIYMPSNPLERATLTLSETGDIQLVEGQDKLAVQLMRALVNDKTSIRSLINSTVNINRNILALFTTVLRNFRQNQIDDTKRFDSGFSGYKLYRKASGNNEAFTQISPNPITHMYTDTDLTNGIAYEYGVTRIEKNVFESMFTDKFTITPTRFTGTQEVVIGNNVTALAGNKQVVLYVDYLRRFQASELLDKIQSIEVTQDETEPRRYVVDVVIKDVNENHLSLSVKSISAVTGN